MECWTVVGSNGKHSNQDASQRKQKDSGSYSEDYGFPWAEFEGILASDPDHQYMKALSSISRFISKRVGSHNTISCLGVGRFATSIESRAQLALVMLLRTRLGITEPIRMYDPAFTVNEAQFIAQRTELTLVSEEDAYPPSALLFCPHTPPVVNARASMVPGATVLCNDLTVYVDRQVSEEGKAKLRPCLDALARRMSVVAVETVKSMPESVRRAVGGLAVQRFRQDGDLEAED
ncbi:hypothetical protein J8273_3294 [Carpediemonas membranifera]|uniref:SRR1-like domain-containing protein n=1 Tax=Carpediemonas membranifera TaxID=201153 RepID=A0A8J6AWA0_9EUKA|nr:hypothetical protein J8273_3294 [Carpediemonas membranifera]|eukprot:KAG9393165.1 hypothetical protein J8273_3294 [Carpediemonas membranifera]